MILKGSQRGGASQLATHLLRTDENEHVHVEQLRGFMASDLRGALAEAEAVAKGTKCKQHLFSLSLNPPKDGNATRDDLFKAVDEAERKLGLVGCPRAVVTHEKNGRLHAHAVWSRIEPEKLKAVNLAFFKTRLAELSKDLFIEHGWELPAGHKQNGDRDPLNYNLAEWQQAKRAGRDPKQLKSLFQDAWKQSKDLRSFKSALAEQGFFLAKGDRRGFVAVDVHGKVYAVARMVGIRTKDLEARLGSPDQLQSVSVVTKDIQCRMTENISAALKETERRQRREIAPLLWQHRQIVRAQRIERVEVLKAHRPVRQRGPMRGVPAQKTDPLANVNARMAKGGVQPKNSDLRIGELAPLLKALPSIRQQQPGESWDAYQNYRRAIERKFEQQLEELKALQRAIEKMRARQLAERQAMAQRIALLIRLERDRERNVLENRPHQLTMEF
jgi:hypothetical protein